MKNGPPVRRSIFSFCQNVPNLATGLNFVKGRVGEVDVPGVHLLLAQAQALANTINMKWIAKEPPTLFFNGILTNSQLFCAFIKVPFISELFEKHIAFSECMMYTIVKFLMSKWRFYYDK